MESQAQFKTCSSSSTDQTKDRNNSANSSSSQFQRRNSKRSRSNRRRQKSKRNNLHQQNLQEQLNQTNNIVMSQKQEEFPENNPQNVVSENLISEITGRSSLTHSHQREVESCIAATRYPLNQYLAMPRYHSVQSDGENLKNNQMDQPMNSPGEASEIMISSMRFGNSTPNLANTSNMSQTTRTRTHSNSSSSSSNCSSLFGGTTIVDEPIKLQPESSTKKSLSIFDQIPERKHSSITVESFTDMPNIGVTVLENNMQPTPEVTRKNIHIKNEMVDSFYKIDEAEETTGVNNSVKVRKTSILDQLNDIITQSDKIKDNISRTASVSETVFNPNKTVEMPPKINKAVETKTKPVIPPKPSITPLTSPKRLTSPDSEIFKLAQKYDSVVTLAQPQEEEKVKNDTYEPLLILDTKKITTTPQKRDDVIVPPSETEGPEQSPEIKISSPIFKSSAIAQTAKSSTIENNKPAETTATSSETNSNNPKSKFDDWSYIYRKNFAAQLKNDRDIGIKRPTAAKSAIHGQASTYFDASNASFHTQVREGHQTKNQEFFFCGEFLREREGFQKH